MIDLFAAAAVAYVERHDGWEQLVEALGVAITALVSPVIPEEAPKGADEVLAVILQDIAARPERASLSALARRYSYSTTYLSELIHERCGMTFTELVTEQRMERAAMLLRATQLPVREVARQVGYTGTSNFYRAFRAHFGCGPAEYRAGAKNKGIWFPENGSPRSVFPVEQFFSGNQMPLFFWGAGEPHPFICSSRPSRTS